MTMNERRQFQVVEIDMATRTFGQELLYSAPQQPVVIGSSHLLFRSFCILSRLYCGHAVLRRLLPATDRICILQSRGGPCSSSVARIPSNRRRHDASCHGSLDS